MRRIVMFNRTSADGYFAAADGNLDWFVPDDEIDKAAGEGMEDVDTMLFGRRTYQLFEGFWPHAAAEDSRTAPDPHTAGRRSEDIRAMATWINDSPKVVFSRTLKEVKWKNSRLVHELDPRGIEAMKKQPGKNMIIFGSGSVVSELTKHGLIDEYRFIVGPTLLGSGRSVISGLSKSTRLNLLEAKKYPSGNVVLSYSRAGQE